MDRRWLLAGPPNTVDQAGSERMGGVRSYVGVRATHVQHNARH